MREAVVSAGKDADGSAAGAAALDDTSLESDLAAAEAFHEVELTTGLEIAGAGASGAGAAATEVEPALTETDNGTTARSAEVTEGGALAPTVENDNETEGTDPPKPAVDALAASTLGASRAGTERTLSAAIASSSSFSV